jgi:tricorn protease-like protein
LRTKGRIRRLASFVAQGKLVVGTNGDGCLKAVDLATKSVSTIVNLGAGTLDGLASDRDGSLLVTHNEGRLFRVSAEDRAAKILDTTARRMNLADFAFDPARNMVVFPTFTDGRVAAFKLGR